MWAPGVHIHCAKVLGSGFQTANGTSLAGGMVSGLAAYFLALDPTLPKPGTGLTAAAAKNRLIAESWPRKENNPFYPNASSNGLAPPLCVDDGGGSAKMGRRGTNDGDSCPQPSSVSSRLTSAVSKSPTAISLRSSFTSPALSEPSLVFTDPSVDGGVYSEKPCFSGTCNHPQSRFRRCIGYVSGAQPAYQCTHWRTGRWGVLDGVNVERSGKSMLVLELGRATTY